MAVVSDPLKIEAFVAALGAEIPSAAVRHGWNIGNLAYSFDSGDQWRLSFYGPHAIYVDRKQYIGGEPTYEVHVQSDELGQVTTETQEQLLDVVRQWVTALGLRDLQ